MDEESQLSVMERGNISLTISTNYKVRLAQKFLAELLGTYCIIFAGCGSVVVNKLYDGTVTFPGICVTWGLIVMTMIYTLGHVSGAHFNPAVTITLSLLGACPFSEVGLYIVSQVLGSTLASVTLTLIMNITSDAFFGTTPAGSTIQSFVVEIILTFILMFIISGACGDDRAVKMQGGIVVGMTIILNVFVGGPISGASMNPARTLGPAIVLRKFTAIWVYICGPIIGAITGAFVYKLLTPTDKSFSDIVKGR
ncbi:putative major intrinsic protein [Helianthus annuus]|uniref:Major intrinsic protein n=2 Tax=Helianthus annuus TaxID=4232 RepID=A0A9K3NGB1_HELAN|nr:putative major intrinsic protein [Helianthus annuus]KAJ0550305.1 putative major intrinsic protein [Helianthus annuus]KAJ0556988.1 putative major intrinsic protein [Helianthus annuus]KAJ0563259.1 putative major intrinsic protein [Helianthus annuus]KAJ0904843.1 putative major intrinsic protein [Helianthus annuus]